MTQTIKESGILRLQKAVEEIENKLNNSKVIDSSAALSKDATKIDTEILKALKSENSKLKQQNSDAKQHLDALIKDLKSQI
jgi:hypothetical protein